MFQIIGFQLIDCRFPNMQHNILLHVLRLAGICISFSFVWYEIYTAGNDKNKLYLTSLKKLTIINYTDLTFETFCKFRF